VVGLCHGFGAEGCRRWVERRREPEPHRSTSVIRDKRNPGTATICGLACGQTVTSRRMSAADTATSVSGPEANSWPRACVYLTSPEPVSTQHVQIITIWPCRGPSPVEVLTHTRGQGGGPQGTAVDLPITL
jgi:hypothetical protein